MSTRNTYLNNLHVPPRELRLVWAELNGLNFSTELNVQKHSTKILLSS